MMLAPEDHKDAWCGGNGGLNNKGLALRDFRRAVITGIEKPKAGLCDRRDLLYTLRAEDGTIATRRVTCGAYPAGLMDGIEKAFKAYTKCTNQPG